MRIDNRVALNTFHKTRSYLDDKKKNSNKNDKKIKTRELRIIFHLQIPFSMEGIQEYIREGVGVG